MKTESTIDTTPARAALLERLREVIAQPYSTLSSDQIASLLYGVVQIMPPREREAFADLSLRFADESAGPDFNPFFRQAGAALAKTGQQLAPVAVPAARIAAPLVGTAVAGPLGGAAAGQLLQLLLPAPTAPPPTRAAAPPLSSPQPSAPAGSLPATALNPAALQLATLLADPHFKQALIGGILGLFGQSTARPRIQEQTVAIPFQEMMKAVSEMALQAADEASRQWKPAWTDEADDWSDTETLPRAPTGTRILALLREADDWRYATPEVASPQPIAHTDELTKWLVQTGLLT